MTKEEIKISEEAKRQILLLRNFLKQNAPALYNALAKKKIAKQQSKQLEVKNALDKQNIIML